MFIWLEAITAANPSKRSAYTTIISGRIPASTLLIDRIPVPIACAVANSDVKALSSISGVGKKTAERIVVELKDKIGQAGALEASSAGRALSESDQKINDAVLALMALGFKQPEAYESIRGAQAVLGPQASVETLVRASLKKGA